VAVQEGSPASTAGLLFGDVLLSLSGTPTSDVHDLLGALAEVPVGEALEVKLLRSAVVQTLSVRVGARP
jgi:S1-C subfamily serine protease